MLFNSGWKGWTYFVFRMRFWPCPGRWWCGLRTWSDGCVSSRTIGATVQSQRRPAGPTASTNPCRAPTGTAAATHQIRAARPSNPKLRVRNLKLFFNVGTFLLCFTNPCFSQTASRFSATRSTAASAPCSDASRVERGGRGCRTPTCSPWGASRRCPTPGWCTAETRSATQRWRATPASPGSSVSVTTRRPTSGEFRHENWPLAWCS